VADVQYEGSKPIRVHYAARIDDQKVPCNPAMKDLVPNDTPTQVFVEAPRPELANLVDELNSEPTLYGRELVLEVQVDKETVAEATWTEKIYDKNSNRERYEIQQRIWRIGTGVGTEADLRQEQRGAMMRRVIEQRKGPKRWSG
jgi:hypothetical protein